MKTSQIILACGLAVLLAGCILSYLKIEPYADYLLVAGALLVIVRGAIRSRERDDKNQNENQNQNEEK